MDSYSTRVLLSGRLQAPDVPLSLVISRRRRKCSKLLRQQIGESNWSCVFPEWPHDLDSHGQPLWRATDWSHCRRTAGKRGRSNPVQHLHVTARAGRGGDDALVLGLAVVVGECRGESHGREKDIHLIEICLPLRAICQPAEVLLLPVRK